MASSLHIEIIRTHLAALRSRINGNNQEKPTEKNLEIFYEEMEGKHEGVVGQFEDHLSKSIQARNYIYLGCIHKVEELQLLH